MKTKYQYLLGGGALAAAVTALAFLLWSPAVPPVPPQPNDDAVEAVGGAPPAGRHFGWVRDDDAVKAVKSTLPFKVFGDTPAGQNADPLPKDVYLWQQYARIGVAIPIHDQGQIGSCVSFGTANAEEVTLAAEIADGGRFDFKPFVEEVIYGGSRHTIGHDQIRGDGSVGAWAAKYVTEYGNLPRGKYGQYDLTTYSVSRCKQWGDRGPPDALLPEIKKYATGSTTQVRDWQDAKKALAQKYGVAVCSEQGFTMQRDSRGVCKPSGKWGHCTCLDGYHTEPNGTEYGHITNSWGPDAHTGPVGWGEPSTAGFWAVSTVIDRMIKEGDTWAFSAVKGFPAKRLDWAARPQPRNALFAFWN